MFKTLKQIFITVLLLLIAGVGGAAVVARARGGQLLSVQSGSMVPILHKGDLVSVKNVPAQQLHVGDVITFVNPKNKSQTITHRIVSLSPQTGQLTTKGDANLAADDAIPYNAVVGKAGVNLPKLGYAVDFIKKPLGLALIIYLPALAIVVVELKRLAAHYRSQESYVLPGYDPRQKRAKGHILKETTKLAAVLLLVSAVVAPYAHAALSSKATLTGNTIRTIQITHPPTNCSSNNNVSVTTNSNQSSSSGNSSTSNNTTGGSATSGNASNNSSTNVNINITNCH